MNRRDWIQGSALAATTLAALGARAQAGGGHEHHHHGGGAGHADLIRATAACSTTGEACLAHCLVLLGQGDKEMAGCAISVNQLLAACGALQKLAGQDSPYTGKFAGLVGQMCADCEKECRKHAGKHEQCKACADACADCVKACKAAAA
jgi:Cys-rich four helix bundle protein (predicted Tat secretion target)